DAVVAPHVVRFAIEKADRLRLTWMKDWYEEIAHRADVLDIDDEAVRRSLGNVHAVDDLARKVIDLFEVEYVAFLHFIGLEVISAFIRSRGRQSIGVHN